MKFLEYFKLFLGKFRSKIIKIDKYEHLNVALQGKTYTVQQQTWDQK